MANTTFVDMQTTVVASWLQDVNNVVYSILGNGTSVPNTISELLTNIGVYSKTQVDSLISGLTNTYQPKSTTLTALSSYNTDGIITQTAANTFTGRSIVGTTNNINVTNGNGVSGNPTIDLPNTTVTAGSYTNSSITVDAKGRITAASSGTSPTIPVKQIVYSTIPASTGTTSIPDDTTPPLSTEGTQIASVVITPSSTANKVRISGNIPISVDVPSGADDVTILSFFRGSTLIGTKRSSIFNADSANREYAFDASFSFIDSPTTISAQTYTIRIGITGVVVAAGRSWSVSSSTALGGYLSNAVFVAEEII